MVGKSDFAPFSALNFCKDNAFFPVQGNKWEDFDKKGGFWYKFAGLAMRFSGDFA